MAHRLRQAAKQDTRKLKGTLEADETYIGGQARNMHHKQRRAVFQGIDRGSPNKVPLFGVKSRDGKVKTKVIKEVNSDEIYRAIMMSVEPGSTLYTDEHRAYDSFGYNPKFKRGVVRHGLGEYVKGDCHTNGIESFWSVWSVFKRGYHCNYHWMSKKHLQRYADEFTHRFNLRGKPMKDVFTDTLTKAARTKQLTYKKLIKS